MSAAVLPICQVLPRVRSSVELAWETLGARSGEENDLFCHSEYSVRLGCIKWRATPQVLACHLLHELSRGQRSFWQPYLSNLPRTFTALAYFSSRDVHELQLGHAMDIVQSVAEALTSSHEAAGPLLAALGAHCLYMLGSCLHASGLYSVRKPVHAWCCMHTVSA